MFRYCWSDTGSFTYDSPGDIVKTYNQDRKSPVGPEFIGLGRKLMLIDSKIAETAAETKPTIQSQLRQKRKSQRHASMSLSDVLLKSTRQHVA